MYKHKKIRYNTFMQPGQTITPGQDPVKVDDTTPIQETQTPVEQPQPVFMPQTENSDPVPVFQPAETNEASIRWTASEYVDHAKGPAWFAAMGLGLFAAVGLVYFLLKDIFASALLGVAGITFAIFAGRRPQVLEYAIGPAGVSIGQRTHPFSDFKSFSLTESGPLPSILLLPLKRFLPPITIFYDPKEEDKIIDALADYLPHEDREPDVVDKLMSRIRF
jgi:hypothetical protein